MQVDPILQFKQWLQEAEVSEINDPNAMALGTADKTGLVSVRMVLLKDIWEGKFVFYTNLSSRKSQQIGENSNAALCFHWKSLEKQVRIEGKVSAVPSELADSYFAKRHPDTQIGAWASRQSEVIEVPGDLEKNIEHYRQKFEGQDIPRPPHWSGFAVTPQRIEFWTQKPFRLHDRHVYIRQNDVWKLETLYP